MRCAASRPRSRGLDVRFGKPDDETGTRSIYGRVKITDADLLERRAEALARSVCPDDPRTHGERRTEALGIIAVNGDVLPCRCGKPDCPATGKDPRAEHLVIHVITNDPGDQDEPAGPTARRQRSRRQRSRRRCGPDDNGPDDDGAGRWARRRVAGRAHPGAVPVRDGDRRRRGDPRTAAGRTTGDGRDDPTGAQPDGPDRGARVPAHHRPAAVRAHPRHHLLLPGMRSPRRVLRPGPYDPLHRRRVDPSGQPQMSMPKTPPTQNILDRTRRLER